jgi:hypothetical protein
MLILYISMSWKIRTRSRRNPTLFFMSGYTKLGGVYMIAFILLVLAVFTLLILAPIILSPTRRNKKR